MILPLPPLLHYFVANTAATAAAVTVNHNGVLVTTNQNERILKNESSKKMRSLGRKDRIRRNETNRLFETV